MLRFRYVCAAHRARFIETVQQEGCLDPAAMEHVRRQLFAWLSETYPRLVLDHYNDESCIGCGLDAWCIDLRDIYAVVRRYAREAAAHAA